MNRCSIFSFWDIFLDVFFYIIKRNCGTPHNITINPPHNQRVKTSTKKKTTYGLYQYRIISIHIWIISIQDYTNNERVKRVLYTIYQHLKRYHHFNTTTHDKKCNAVLLTSSPTMHHITLPQDERTTANNIFILERPQPIKCRTIYHRWNNSTI